METKEEQENIIEFLEERKPAFYRGRTQRRDHSGPILQARARLSENKVQGPQDAIVSEMTKRLPMEKILHFHGMMESPGSWKVVKLVFLRKPDAAPTKGIRSYRAIALTSVMSKWYASYILLRFEKEKEPEKWKKLLFGGLDGTSCQHLQVMMTNVIQKHWEWQEERNPVMKLGTVVRPTLYLASLDIKTAFDEAKPKQVAKIMDNHSTHGWIIAALLREMSGLSGKAMFECVESSFAFNRCLRQGSVEAPRLWQKIANVEEEWMTKRIGVPLDVEGEGVQFHVGRQLLDDVALQETPGADVKRPH